MSTNPEQQFPSNLTVRLVIMAATLGVLLPASAPALEPPPAALLGLDSDGDGQPNVTEWFTGTNPNLSADAVKIDSVAKLTAPDRIQLSWPSISGRSYNVEKSSALGAWQVVSTLTATGSRATTAIPYAPATEKKLFFRVTSAYNTGTAPFISGFTADKNSPLTTAAFVRFNLKAYHPSGIAAVQLLDGATMIGNAVQTGQCEWVFDWYADERFNGNHSFKARMISDPGVLLDSSAIAFTVNVPAGRQRFAICDTLEISANTVSTVGITRTFSNNVQIGPFTLAGSTTVTMNLTTHMITGSGPLFAPGGIQITSSPWSFDAARCLLSLTGSVPSPMALIPGFLTLTPAAVPQMNMMPTSGGPIPVGIRGLGSLSGSFPGRSPVSSVSASGTWDAPFSGTLLFSCSQPTTLGSGVSADSGSVITLQGVVVGLAPSPQPLPLAALVPLVVNGRLNFPAGTGGPAAKIDGFMEAKLPVTTLDPSLPPLVQGKYVGSGLPVIGSVDPDGSFRPAALPPQPEYLLQYLANFVPLDPACLPIEGGRVIADALGNLPPCEWRPVIPCAGGGRQTLALRFPSGLKIVKSGATSLLQFLHMKLATGPDCPLQLAENYEIHASSTLTLDMDDSVSIQDILGVLGINASLGIHVKIFKHFDVTVRAARFTPKGLVGAVLDFLDDAAVSILDLFPDPGDSFADFELDFQCPEWIEIPCRWPASLPGGPGGGYVFDAGGPWECHVRLQPDGGICVYGSAKIRIGTSGPSFNAEINACGDKICIEHLAEDLDKLFSASWTLPVAETIDAGIAATKVALDPVAKALLPKICTYERQSVALLRWLDQNPLTDPGPRRNYAEMLRRQGKAMLESFANAKSAVPALPAPGEIQAFIRQLGREARTASNFDALLEVWMTLERLKASGVPTVGDLQSARNEAWDEITDRLDANVAISVDTALRAVQMDRERKALLAQAGQAEDDAGAATRAGRVIDRAASLAAADLNVAAGVIDVTLNPVVRALSRDETWSHVEAFVTLFSDANAQGIPVTAAARKQELLTQLGKQMDFLLEQLLADGAVLLRGDQQAHLLQMSRYLQMLKWIASGDLPSQVVPSLTAAAAMTSLESAVNSLAQGDAAAVSASVYSLLNAEKEQSGIIREKILQLAPAGTIIPTQALQQYYARLRAHLDAGWAYLPALSAGELRSLLEAGTENARLRDQLGLGDGTIAWESAQRLSAVIDRLVVLSNSQTDITILETAKAAAMLLMDESWRFDGLPVPNETKRQFCLLEAEKCGFRLLALANTLRDRAVSPVTLNWTGGVKVEQVAAGFCYDIATHAFSGWASGSLVLPGFGQSFNLKRLQFASDGTATLEVEAVNPPGFPGTTFTLNGTISPGGVWSLTGTAATNLTKPSSLPWNITVQSGASITLNNSGVHIAVNSSTGGASASGTLDVTPAGTATFSGTLSLDTSIVTTGIYSIIPTGAGTVLSLTVSGGATATLTGSKLRLGGPFNGLDIPLPTLTLNASYDFFEATPSPVSGTLASYLLNAVKVKVQRIGGSIQVPSFSCTIPALGELPAIPLTGTIGSDGAINLASAASSPTILGFSTSGSFSFNSPGVTYQSRLSGLSPEAWWKLDDVGTFSTTADATGHGHTGSHTPSTVLNQPGAGYPSAGTSFRFNGIDASVSVPDADTLEGGSAMTVTAWIKVNAFTQSWQPIVTKGDATWRLHRYGDTNFVSFGTNHPGYSDLESTIAVNDGKWHHVTGVFTGTKKLLYIDGRLDRQADVSGAIPANSQPVMIGSNSDYPTRDWNGYIDEVAFWRRGLSGAEVRDLYASGVGAALQFTGSITVPGFTGASFSVNGTVSHDGAFTLTGALPNLATGSFALTTSGGGSLSLTLGNSGITVPASRLALGELFLPLDLPSFTIPASGDFNLPFSPPELNLRGFKFATPSLVFHRLGGVTSLDSAVLTLMVPAPPAPAVPVPYPNISITGNTPSFPTGSITRNFAGFDVTGGFDLAAPPQNAQTRMAALNPEAWWKLDETSTLSGVADATGNGHTGTRVGTVGINQTGSTYPAPGKSYGFAGIDGYITVPSAKEFEGGTEMTVTAWVKVNSLNRSWQAIVSKGDTSWRLARYGDSNQVSFDTTDAIGHRSLPSTVSINDGAWHHVTGVYSGGIKSLYVDGRLEATDNLRADPINKNSFPVMIGENAEANGRNWNGFIDEVAFFRRGLSASEVRELYASGNGLRLGFSGNVNLDDHIQTSLSGTISAGGGYEFNGALAANNSFRGFPFLSAGSAFTFAHTETNSTAFTGAMNLGLMPVTYGTRALNSGIRFSGSFTRAGSVTTVNLSVNDSTANLCGYQPKSPGLDLTLAGDAAVNGSINFADFRFGPLGNEIPDIGLPTFGGSIAAATGNLSTGGFPNSPITLRNLYAPSNFPSFNNNGLNVAAGFDLVITIGGFTRDLGEASAAGIISPSGSYSLTGGAIITLDGDTLENAPGSGQFPIRFQSPDIGHTIVPWNVTPVLQWKGLDLNINNFVLNQNGFGYSMSKSGDTGWMTWVTDPSGIFAWMQDRLEWNVNFSYDLSSNKVSGAMNGQAKWSWRTFAAPPDPPGPLGPPPTSGTITATGGVGSDGSFSFNPPDLIFWGRNTFSHDIW